MLKTRYWPLIKSAQTTLLLATGLAGYLSARCPMTSWTTVSILSVTLFLAISGSTVLNMWYDRDIDACMKRTAGRPLPSGKVKPWEALFLGTLLSGLGVGGALFLSPLYGMIVFFGVFFDVVIYTVWLKRRTPWSIVWGGISGGMPILAGRTLGAGQIDGIGLLLALAVLFWIPTHILTISLRSQTDYQTAGVPTFPSLYGYSASRFMIAISSMMAAAAIALAAFRIGMGTGHFSLLIVMSLVLLVLALISLARPSERINFSLFKYASIYMLSVMLLVMFGGLNF
jgi:heme o synthase